MDKATKNHRPGEPAESYPQGSLLQLIEKAQTLDSGKLEHFNILLSALLECYLKEETRATVILSNEIKGKTQIIPINATQEDVVGMIDLMADAFRANHHSLSVGSLN